MKWLSFFLVPIAIISAAPPSAEALHTMEGEAAVAHQKNTASSEVLVITALERANDIKHVYEFVKKHTGGSGLVLKMKDGIILHNILTLDVMPGGTLMVVQANTMKGQKYQVIRTENVKEVLID